jgi:hypothetical protein
MVENLNIQGNVPKTCFPIGILTEPPVFISESWPGFGEAD